MKQSPSPLISIVGNDEIAKDIGKAFWNALNCQESVRGDACDECSKQRWSDWDVEWHVFPGTRETPRYPLLSKTVYLAFQHIDGFMEFQIKEKVGDYIDPDSLILLVLAFQGEKSAIIKAAKDLVNLQTYTEFIQHLTSILTNILYLKNNVDVKEVEKVKALSTLSVRMSAHDIASCLRILWDAQTKMMLSDGLAIQQVALLLSEVFQPFTEDFSYELFTSGSETPIKVIDNNLEQPLDLDRMLAIARE